MYHRQLRPLLGDDANVPASRLKVRVAAVAADGTDASFDEAVPVEWAGSALPPRVANFQKDFITKYINPTEIYGRMDQLAAQFPDIVEAITLPNKTEGYQRPGHGHDGRHDGPDRQPERGQTRRPPCSCSRGRSATRAVTTSPPSSRPPSTPRAPRCRTRRCRSR